MTVARVAVQPLAYRPRDAALVLGISRTQLYQMIAAGEIEARKLSGATIIRHDEIARVIEGSMPISVKVHPPLRRKVAGVA